MFTKVLNTKQFVFVEPWINVSIMVSVMKLFTSVYIFLASVTSSQTINWTMDRKLEPGSLYWFCGTHFLWKLLSGESVHKKNFSNLFIHTSAVYNGSSFKHWMLLHTVLQWKLMKYVTLQMYKKRKKCSIIKTNVQCIFVFYLPIDLTSTACRILRMPT